MFKTVYLFGSAVIILALMSGCSNDQAAVAKYTLGTNENLVRIKDVKDDVINYLMYQPSNQNDTNWHKDMIFDLKIYPDVVLAEEMERSFTNLTNIRASYEYEYKKEVLTDLYQKGQHLMKERINNTAFDIARVSRILISANRYTNIRRGIPVITNINGKQSMVTNYKDESRKLSDGEYKALLVQKEKEANEILQTLKNSRNLDKDFRNLAKLRSNDPDSAKKGGDLGYVTYNAVETNLLSAIFSASHKGLLDTVIRTGMNDSGDGFQIVYVTETKKQKKPEEIAKMMDRNSSMMVMAHLSAHYSQEDLEKNYKQLFTADLTNGVVKIGGKVYKPGNLKDEEELFTVFNKPYNWKMAKDIILVFVPMFTNQLNINNFVLQMNNLKNFVYYFEMAKEKGLEAKQKDLDNLKGMILKKLASLEFNQDFNKEITASLNKDPGAVTAYYRSNATNFTKEVNGKKVAKTFKESEAEIKGILHDQLQKSKYKEWKDKMNTKYKVIYLNDGIKDLMTLDKKKLSKTQGSSRK